MVVDANTATAGTIGGGCSESAVMRQAYYLIGTGEHKCVTIDMSNDIAAQEGMVCGGQMKVVVADLGIKTTTYSEKKSINTGIKCHILSGIHRF